jgi:hypothetical protein
MKSVLAALLAGASLTLSAGAFAVTLSNVETNGNVFDNSASSAALISPSIELKSASPIVFTFVVDEEDAGGTVAFNSSIANGAGTAWRSLEVALTGGTVVLAGSVTPQFGAIDGRSGDAVTETITFSPGEPFGVDLGNPFSQAGAQDWLIGLGGLQAGDRLTVTVTAGLVPEPGTYAMLLAGLSLLGWGVRRRA